MLFFALLPAVLAQCGLDANIDPEGKCNVDSNGYANLDHDSFTGGFSLAVSAKAQTTDADGVRTHGATNGAPAWFADDKRYVLDCPQVADEKTVKFTVTRPETLTAFGAEWIQMFPKDSWENVTNEYEPFSFNDYGSKIPLFEFRPQTDPCVNGLLTDGVTTCVEGFTRQDNTRNELNVFMEVSVEGDFEIKYGNPNTVSEGTIGDAAAKWVAHEFKQTLLRVGNPWANCAAGAAGTGNYADVGVVLPAFYGNPNLNYDTYNSLIADLADAAVPVKVVLQIYGNGIDAWTESGVTDASYSQCYRAGNECPLDHEVCDPTYCNLDRWREIITNLKAVAGGNVQVLAHIDTYPSANTDSETGDSTQYTSAAIIADMQSYKDNAATDGFYFAQANGGKAAVDNLLAISDSDATGFVVFASGEPLFDKSALEHAGNPDVWITLAEDVNNMGIWTPFSWFSAVAAKQWGAIIDSVPAADIDETATTLFDRGYGYVYLHSAASFDDESTTTTAAVARVATQSTSRRLSETPERRLQESTTAWGCDDTLFECRPVCLQTTGVTSMKVADAQCTEASMDQCSCPCYHDAHWTCQGEEVVCVATMRLESMVVGETVCTARGSPKPELTSFQERRASSCEKKPTTRGAWPAQTCLEQWNPTNTVEEEVTEDTVDTEDTEDTEDTVAVAEEDITIESFAAPAFLAAIFFVQA